MMRKEPDAISHLNPVTAPHSDSPTKHPSDKEMKERSRGWTYGRQPSTWQLLVLRLEHRDVSEPVMKLSEGLMQDHGEFHPNIFLGNSLQKSASCLLLAAPPMPRVWEMSCLSYWKRLQKELFQCSQMWAVSFMGSTEKDEWTSETKPLSPSTWCSVPWNCRSIWVCPRTTSAGKNKESPFPRSQWEELGTNSTNG